VKVSGEATLHAPVQDVWAALNDPAVLVRTIPGCERLESTGPDAYRMTVTAGVASIKGTYSGQVQLSDQVAPSSFLMSASGAGGPGTVSTEVRVALADAGDGSTRLSYDADAVVGGVVAGVGQRMLVAVAKKTAGEFFRAVDDVLTGTAPAVAVPAVPTGATAPAEPGVFVAPSAPALSGRPGEFARGALLGAAIALAGVLVGVLAGRRRQP
jgi:carbon monoxide dehydrogenase subunit G